MRKNIYWQKAAISRLSSLRLDEAAAVSLPYQLRSLQDPLQTKDLSERDARFNDAVLRLELRERLNSARRRNRETHRALEVLNERERRVLQLRWMEREPLTDEALAEALQLSLSGTMKLQLSALRHFAEALYSIREEA